MKKICFMHAVSLFLLVIVVLSAFREKPKENDLARAESTLSKIFNLYDAGHDYLLNEFYPEKPDNYITYLENKDSVTVRRVAYLWPASGVFSGVNALLKATGDKQYLKLLEEKVVPGLEHYYDLIREPASYQSYITRAGMSDRYYDDNIWLSLDFCETYMLTRKPEYLNKSLKTWQFVISGWDNELGGGIYWCEQKKRSKNTCSNAPASVLAFKLFEATGDSSYFKWGLRIYNWTKIILQDSTDHLYFDNVNLEGNIARKKYTYNSGQMLQSAAILYRLTGNKTYLDEANRIAKSAIEYFTNEYITTEGKKIRLFKNTGNWFNAILLRGYVELYAIDRNSHYLSVFRDNLEQVWNHVRDINGLFNKDWTGQKEEKYKSLLDQASLVEIWATLARI